MRFLLPLILDLEFFVLRSFKSFCFKTSNQTSSSSQKRLDSSLACLSVGPRDRTHLSRQKRSNRALSSPALPLMPTRWAAWLAEPWFWGFCFSFLRILFIARQWSQHSGGRGRRCLWAQGQSDLQSKCQDSSKEKPCISAASLLFTVTAWGSGVSSKHMYLLSHLNSQRAIMLLVSKLPPTRLPTRRTGSHFPLSSDSSNTS